MRKLLEKLQPKTIRIHTRRPIDDGKKSRREIDGAVSVQEWENFYKRARKTRRRGSK